ncbi:ATP-binding protein [Novosphingobium sp. JCM 18896]|uniref:ATP-binding protein n=1 Tax=Novosphingobium sp. JCM 18896 TaxID=2989731 RepID=UPI002222BD8A|nr:ATP-binding protein [Novosphingobium sp. JCM 18896]MCW1428316.1 ATP-binding protein [Novosphingobium sp. JCM 18896]
MTIVVALHGIESTGKSTLAAELAAALGAVWVPEYGREYCLEHGTDCSAEDLQAIARVQQERIAAAPGGLVVTDTDWLMTRAWHKMMLGPDMGGPAYPLADLYLHLAPDVEWVDDGLRLHAEAQERFRFDGLCRDELDRFDVRWVEIRGDWPARRAAALAAIAAL